jgi:hypothetical protein
VPTVDLDARARERLVGEQGADLGDPGFGDSRSNSPVNAGSRARPSSPSRQASGCS